MTNKQNAGYDIGTFADYLRSLTGEFDRPPTTDKDVVDLATYLGRVSAERTGRGENTGGHADVVECPRDHK